ncbi:SAGA complex subunit Ngg1 [Schizosaccharomyces japonicus yFS275]|uniref:SAGA complex subunit Ngg1 n=1 Tax=Schizosaccharomyces japonicus (strain yFS275 / FY16936) TaxID=402676 RepID=B6JYP6_SCHJY|nr:SAGA complex subunit Ngg1 [Schizosaccharomyces japonicus yFS275]EEB06664.1 SAGA complex subunit Ngg1 [Schizosaccharomyces japonicus yFS275]
MSADETKNTSEKEPVVITEVEDLSAYESLKKFSDTPSAGSVPDVSTLWKLLSELQNLHDFEFRRKSLFKKECERLKRLLEKRTAEADSSATNSKDATDVSIVKTEEDLGLVNGSTTEIATKDFVSDETEEGPKPKKLKVEEPAHDGVSAQELGKTETALDLPVREKDVDDNANAKTAEDLFTGCLETKLLTTESDEEKKRLLAVASFPHDDLLNLVAGEPATADFSYSKPSNQVAISTYYGALEQYFRAFTEDDMNFLREEPDIQSAFVIPPLGPHYYDVWAEEEDVANFYAAPMRQSLSVAPHGFASSIQESNLHTEDISCGPLTERLLSALIQQPADVADSDDDASILTSDKLESPSTSKTEANVVSENSPDPSSTKDDEQPSSEQAEAAENEETPFTDMSFSRFEDYLKQRLRNLNMLYEEDVDWTRRKDDEVCATLRDLQEQLKHVAEHNKQRKKAILDLLPHEMAFQEFTTVLFDLDKQIEQAYMKRNRSLKAKKKRVVVDKNSLAAMNSLAGIKALIKKRKTWLETVGLLFQDRLNPSTLGLDKPLFVEQTVSSESVAQSSSPRREGSSSEKPSQAQERSTTVSTTAPQG